MTDRYRIVRYYFTGGQRTIARGLTLEQAQSHCSDPRTSSCHTAKSSSRTKRSGGWFDGYRAEQGR